MKLSKNFINDLNGDLIQIEPIIGIFAHTGDELFYEPYFDRTSNFLFSQKTHTVDVEYFQEVNGQPVAVSKSLTSLPILKDLSNIKTSIDYDSKKIKVGRIRLNLSNTINLTEKYTDKPEIIENINGSYIDITNTNWIGKNIFIWFKTQSTNKIQIDPDYSIPLDFDDNAMPLFYRGKITRFEHTDTQIKIQAEDQTTMLMGDKLIPKYQVSDMAIYQPELYAGLREKDIEENTSIPMVYGRVGKAVALPSFQEVANSEFVADYIHDWHMVGNIYPTSNLPFDVNTDYQLEKRNWLYIKSGHHWLISDMSIVPELKYPKDYDSFPRSQIIGNVTGTEDLIVPDFAADPQKFITLAYQNRLVKSTISDKTSDARMIDMITASDTGDFTELTNSSKLNNNAGYSKRWYHADDPIFNAGISDTNYAYQTEKNYNQIVLGAGQVIDDLRWGGSWIFYELEDGCDEEMISHHQSQGASDWSYYEDTIIGARWMANARFTTYPVAFAKNASGANLFIDEADWYDLIASELGLFHWWQKQGLWNCLVKPDIWREIKEGGTYEYAGVIQTAQYLFNTTDTSSLPSDFVDYPNDKLWGRYACLPTYSRWNETETTTSSSYWGLPINGIFDNENSWWENVNNEVQGWEDGDTPKDFRYGCIWYGDVIASSHTISGITPNSNSFEIKDFAIKHTVKIPNLRDRDVSASIIGRVDSMFTNDTALMWENITEDDQQAEFNSWLTELLAGITISDELDVFNGDWVTPGSWLVEAAAGVNFYYTVSNNVWNIPQKLRYFMNNALYNYADNLGLDTAGLGSWSYSSTGSSLPANFDSTFSMMWEDLYPGIWKGHEFGQEFMLENGLMLKEGMDNFTVTNPNFSFKEYFKVLSKDPDRAILEQIPLFRDWQFFRQVIYPVHLMTRAVYTFGWIYHSGQAGWFNDSGTLESTKFVPFDPSGGGQLPGGGGIDIPHRDWSDWFEKMQTITPEDWDLYNDTGTYNVGLDKMGISEGQSHFAYQYQATYLGHYEDMEDLYYNISLFMFNGLIPDEAFDIYKGLAAVGNQWENIQNIWGTGGQMWAGWGEQNKHTTLSEKFAALPDFLEGCIMRYFDMYYLYHPLGGSLNPLPVEDQEYGAGRAIWNKLRPTTGKWFTALADNAEDLKTSLKLTWLSQWQGHNIDFEETATAQGIIERPSDIAMHVMASEMDYGTKITSNGILNGKVELNPASFDFKSVAETRINHDDWKMGFSVIEKEKGRELVESLMAETKSYPLFLPTGQFGFLTIKERYSKADIDHTIDGKDVIAYKFSKSKIEDVCTNIKVNFRHDPVTKTYSWNYTYHIEDWLPEYTGFDYYGTTEAETFKEINSKYHVDPSTVDKWAKYYLRNNCNVHNIIEIELPLKWLKVQIGEVIHVPLIDGLSFGVDYSKLQQVSGQYVYPLWIVMEQIVSKNKVKIKAYQLHYLDSGSNHTWTELDGSLPDISGNPNKEHSTYFFNWQGPQHHSVPNYNYVDNVTIDSGFELPHYVFRNPAGQYTMEDMDEVLNLVFLILQSEIVGAFQQTEDAIATGLLKMGEHRRLTTYDIYGNSMAPNQPFDPVAAIRMSSIFSHNGIV